MFTTTVNHTAVKLTAIKYTALNHVIHIRHIHKFLITL